MKKFLYFINLLVCTSIGLWVIKALLDYNNYTRHTELYATNGWLWYTDVFLWGKYVVLIVAVLLIVKMLITFCFSNTSSGK